ncbi:MAG: hypothetical protein ACE37K_23160 [Planctomycetota bacterium]
MLQRRFVHAVVVLATLTLCCFPLTAQKKRPQPAGGGRRITEFPVPDAAPVDVATATKLAMQGLIGLEEEGGQWPYEGVYREDRGQLPQGYRVGGTSIAILGMVCAPGYRDDEARVAAVDRALRFVLKTLEVDRMQKGFQGGYDVRGWGHIYALTCLLHLQDAKMVPKELAEQVDKKVPWLVETLVESAIPKNGGWNYSRRAGYMSPRNRASTFMTAPALQALFHAKKRGHAVPDDVVEQALDALDRSRSVGGGYAYGSSSQNRNDIEEEDIRSIMDKTPSAAARAAVCETTLMLAGRGNAERHAAAIDLFFEHWDDLAVRKSQLNTHIPPYGIAPYYFMFGHMYTAQAIEQLADADRRAHYRTRMREYLARSIEQNGTWNDRQFGRSASYGTAMALLAMHMPHLPKPFAWRAASAKK